MVKLVKMASTSDTQNTSASKLSVVEQKKEYHKLLDKLSLLDNDSVDNTQRMESTMQIVDEVKTLATATTSNTTVALLDSYVLRQAAQQALMAATNIEVNTNVYDADTLAQHIRENPSFWSFPLPRRVPSATALHGAFEPALPPVNRARAPRRRAAQQRNVEVRKPDKVATLENVQEDTAMVSRVRRAVKSACRRGPLGLFQCVLDPGSFARTVHNIYYVSFLVRDGEVEIYVDEERGIPMIRPIARAQRPERDISLENQFIVSLDMARWRKLIEVCGIKEPMLVD